MLRCKKCKVELPGSPRYCPLCQGSLSGTPAPGENVYPDIPPVEAPSRRVLSIIIFATIAAAAICVAVNLSVPYGGWWSLFVLAGIGSFWLSFLVADRKLCNIPKHILRQAVIFSLLALLWDIFTGFRRWSVEFVIPILWTCAMAAQAIMAKIMKLRSEDYIIYLVFDSLVGLLSLILILIGVLHVIIPWAACFACSVIMIAGLIFFEGKTLWSEIHRRMHL